MNLPKYEGLKLFSREFVVLGLIFCFIADLFLLFAFTDRRLAETNRDLMKDLGNVSPRNSWKRCRRDTTQYQICMLSTGMCAGEHM